MDANVRIVRVVPGGELSPKRQKPQRPPARIHFDPPNQERVFAIYWRGDKRGFFDAIVEDIDKDNRLLRRYPVRNDYVDGLLTPLPADTPLPQEWLDEHSEKVEILTYLGARILYDLQYTLRW